MTLRNMVLNWFRNTFAQTSTVTLQMIDCPWSIYFFSMLIYTPTFAAGSKTLSLFKPAIKFASWNEWSHCIFKGLQLLFLTEGEDIITFKKKVERKRREKYCVSLSLPPPLPLSPHVYTRPSLLSIYIHHSHTKKVKQWKLSRKQQLWTLYQSAVPNGYPWHFSQVIALVT